MDHESSMMRLAPGTLIVFEGLDRTGKSTQIDRLRLLPGWRPAPAFFHLPSGATRMTEAVYRLTESEPITSALARQLLHLACHAENSRALSVARAGGGVVLDRWWWSTVAYGWYGGDLAAEGVDRAAFMGMIDMVWRIHPADLVLLFTTPYQRDELNRTTVRKGYADLAEADPMRTVEVPPGDPDATTEFIFAQLRERHLLIGSI